MNSKKTKKPLRRAKRWGARIWPMAGRLAAILAAVTVMGLMFSALQAVGSMALRAVISLAILSGVLLMLYSEGLTRGVADADASHAADKLEKLGRPLSRREEAACYQPMKALCACLIVFGVPLVLGAYLAATAEPYTYALQDLPSWLTGTYGAREDVMAPLAAYAQTASVSARDIIRLIVRLTVLIYINLFPDPQTMAQLVDQLTPLMVLSYPVACMIGYLRAPAVYAKRQSMQRRIMCANRCSTSSAGMWKTRGCSICSRARARCRWRRSAGARAARCWWIWTGRPARPLRKTWRPRGWAKNAA